uniref:Uncharacterized protein n=1 Tax=Arundo donax TaxID=35708 RepID=A0A0A8Y4R8_ARUDO
MQQYLASSHLLFQPSSGAIRALADASYHHRSSSEVSSTR